MMALHTGTARDKECACLISHSGHFLGAEEATSKPKTLMIFGDQEIAHPQISQLFLGSAEYLRDLSVPVEEHTCKNLAHGLNCEAFDTARGFIAKSFGIAEPAPAAAPKGPKPPRLL
jgi:predicted esterase